MGEEEEEGNEGRRRGGRPSPTELRCLIGLLTERCEATRHACICLLGCVRGERRLLACERCLARRRIGLREAHPRLSRQAAHLRRAEMERAGSTAAGDLVERALRR